MKKNILLALILPILAWISACSSSSIEELKRSELFTLHLGKMEDQIDLFQVRGELLTSKNRIAMRDGLFYIANGSSAKIMGFSSYGDLIFLLYNANRNPQPVSFSAGGGKDLAATRRAVAYPLMSIGEIAVDSEKRIYVEDVVAEERRIKDRDSGAILSRVILRFDRHGKVLDSLGQEGVGGTPFPYIDSLYITGRDEPVVICRTTQQWVVFWFSSAGSLLHRISIDPKILPIPEKDIIPMVAKIHPDLKRPFLYIMLTYYQGGVDDSTRMPAAVKTFPARIYGLSLESGKFESFIEIPQNGTRKEQVGTRQTDVPAPPFEFLGMSSSGHFFMLRNEDSNRYQLMILDRMGRVANRRYLNIEDSELYFRLLKLSDEGILYALLAYEFAVRIVWWRSDRLLREETP